MFLSEYAWQLINIITDSVWIVFSFRYSPDEDLLPILYLHCDYSLEIGKGTQMEYNLDAIERRLMEKVCYGKTFITEKLEHFKYRDDVQSAREFINMRKRVKQV